MQCVFPTYQAAFARASLAIQARDAQALRAVTVSAEDLPVDESMATLLALSDAKRGRAERSRLALCQAMCGLCNCDAPDFEQGARVVPFRKR